ncbi:MAG: FCD domain-containing protein [Acidimicrobiia bacterium]|nr:FCD domain-containing protein [Acidimicrobiia bacterium]
MTSEDGAEGQLEVQPAIPAYQQVAEQLTSLILAGELSQGQRLPVEAALAAEFGVSRSTVREALRVMSAQNLVVTLRGVTGGTFVVHPEPNQVSDYLEASLGLLSGSRAVELDELLEARELLEVPAARLAAERATDDQIEAMEAMLADPPDVVAGHRFEGNRSFHSTILAASGNSLLLVMTEPVFGVLRTHILRDSAPPTFWKRVAKDHRKIADAIAARDGDRAADEMATHLHKLRGTYEGLYRTVGE